MTAEPEPRLADLVSGAVRDVQTLVSGEVSSPRPSWPGPPSAVRLEAGSSAWPSSWRSSRC